MKKHFFNVMLVITLILFFNSSQVLAATTKKKTTVGKTTTTTSVTTTTSTKKTTTAKKICPYNIRVNMLEEAKNINVSYSFRNSGGLYGDGAYDGTVDGFSIIINNIPKSMYINVSNQVNQNKLYITYLDTGNDEIKYRCDQTPIDPTEMEKTKKLVNNGRFVFNVCETSKVVKYYLTIRASRMSLIEYLNENYHEDYYNKFYDNNYETYYQKMLTQYHNDTVKASSEAQKLVEKDTQAEIVAIADACANRDVRNLSITTPRKNPWHDNIPNCKDKELEDSYYCKEWVTYNFKISRDEAIQRLIDSKKRKSDDSYFYDDSERDELYDFFVQYGLIIVLVIALLVVLDIAFILYNLWRRKEKGKL